jgi:hypothetical protein
MKNLSRRDFLRGAAAAGAAATLPVHVFAQHAPAKSVGANDILRIAVCGVKGRGLAHIGEWTKMKDVQEELERPEAEREPYHGWPTRRPAAGSPPFPGLAEDARGNHRRAAGGHLQTPTPSCP